MCFAQKSDYKGFLVYFVERHSLHKISGSGIVEIFKENTNLTFLYKINISGFKKVSAKNKIASSKN